MKDKLMLIVPMLHQGGFERVCVTTARLLEPYYDITIVIFDSADIDYDVDGLKIIDIRMGVQNGILRKLFTMIRRSIKLRTIKRQLQPKAAYSFGLTANLVNSLSKTKGTKVWLGLRSYGDIEETSKMRLFVKKADLIICCSKVIEEKLRVQFHTTKTTTLYNPFDVDNMKETALQKKPDFPWDSSQVRCLISMGREDDVKGFWHMLKAFCEVHKQLPDTRLAILGAGDFSNYKKLAEELGISEQVYFAGLQKEPYCFLRESDVYLLTSSIEGFPNALVEGMAMGLPAVSTDCLTGPGEILMKNCTGRVFNESTDTNEMQFDREQIVWGDFGVLVPVMNGEKDLSTTIMPEEINMAQAVITLLMDERKLQQYQKAAQERAKIFSYDSYIQRFQELMHESK